MFLADQNILSYLLDRHIELFKNRYNDRLLLIKQGDKNMNGLVADAFSKASVCAA